MNTRETLKINSKGHLEIGGADCTELVKEFGTPLYVLDESYVREMMGYFVFNGRKNAGLSQRGVADALAGSALMLKLFYPEEPTAVESTEQLAKEAVTQFGQYHKTAAAIFPDIDFGEPPESSDD